MVHVAYLMLLLPLAGFLVLVTFGRRIGDPVAGIIGTVAVGGAFVVACIVLAGLLGLPDNHQVVVHNYFTWFSAGGLSRARRHAGRPAVDDDVHVHHVRQRVHPPLLHRLHEG